MGVHRLLKTRPGFWVRVNRKMSPVNIGRNRVYWVGLCGQRRDGGLEIQSQNVVRSSRGKETLVVPALHSPLQLRRPHPRTLDAAATTSLHTTLPKVKIPGRNIALPTPPGCRGGVTWLCLASVDPANGEEKK